jgi:hypothetical protein
MQLRVIQQFALDHPSVLRLQKIQMGQH